jgi:hypothetical protein
MPTIDLPIRNARVVPRVFDEVRAFHRPHLSPNIDKGAVASIRKWLLA